MPVARTPSTRSWSARNTRLITPRAARTTCDTRAVEVQGRRCCSRVARGLLSVSARLLHAAADPVHRPQCARVGDRRDGVRLHPPAPRGQESRGGNAPATNRRRLAAPAAQHPPPNAYMRSLFVVSATSKVSTRSTSTPADNRRAGRPRADAAQPPSPRVRMSISPKCHSSRTCTRSTPQHSTGHTCAPGSRNDAAEPVRGHRRRWRAGEN